jgi:hypothetical protein
MDDEGSKETKTNNDEYTLGVSLLLTFVGLKAVKQML